MIIFNNKGRATNFIARGEDNRVFDIHSTMRIEDLYDWLIHNEGLPEGVEIAQYNTVDAPSVFEMPVEEDNSVEAQLNRTVYVWNDTTQTDNLGHIGFVDLMESLKTARRTFAEAADYYTLEAQFNGLNTPAPDGMRVTFGHFTEVDVVREELIAHLADSLGVYPTLHNDTEVSLAEKQQLGRDANRLRWTFKGQRFAEVPSIEKIKAFESWSKYEQGLVADGLVFPGDLLRNAYIVKTNNPDTILTPDRVTGNQSISQAGAQLLADCERLFIEKFRRAPRVLEDYVKAQVMVGITSAQTIVDGFNLKALGSVAKLGSEVLYALVPHCPFNEFKPEQIAYLATHIKLIDARYLVENGFGEWFSKHRNESMADLTELLQTYTVHDIGRWDLDKSARQMIEFIKTRRGREDCQSYEAYYHYSFADNEVAIRGKNLVVTEGNLKMYFLAKDDYRNFTVGYDTYCCQHWHGAGGSCVYKYTTDPFAACVVIERAGKVLGQSFVFTDEVNDTFVFDNIEFANDRVVADYADIIATFVDALPYKNVHMGTGYVVGQYRTWGQSLGTGAYPMAIMPTTLDKNTHIYTDYHSSARVFKNDGEMFIKKGHGRVEWKELEPTRWDALRDSAAKVLLNDCTMTVQERLSFSNRDISEIGDERMIQLIIKYPTLASSMEAVPEAWQEQMADRVRWPKQLQFIPNPIQVVRTKVLAELPEQALVWSEYCTRADWITVLCKEPSLTEKCPFPLDTEMVTAIYEAKGEKALPYIPIGMLEPAELTRLIERNPRSVLSVDNPSEDLLVTAVVRNPLLLSALGTIINSDGHPALSDRVGRAAVESLPASVIFWEEAPHDVCVEAIHHQPTLIRNLAHRFPDLRAEAIRTNPDTIWAVPEATDEERELADQVRNERAGLVPPGEETPLPFEMELTPDDMLAGVAGMAE